MSDADSVGGCRAPARHDEVLLVGPEEARALLERNGELGRPTNRDLSSGVDLHDFDRKASRG